MVACLMKNRTHLHSQTKANGRRRQALDAFRDWANKSRPFASSEYTGSPERFWAEICKVIPRAQTSRQVSGGVRTVTIDLADLQNNFEKYLRGEVI